MKISILYTTVGSEKDAEKLAEAVVSNKLAACVNIMTNNKSVYLWDGELKKSNECYMIFKTKSALVQELEKMILENHPYEAPCILKFEAECSENLFDFF